MNIICVRWNSSMFDKYHFFNRYHVTDTSLKNRKPLRNRLSSVYQTLSQANSLLSNSGFVRKKLPVRISSKCLVAIETARFYHLCNLVGYVFRHLLLFYVVAMYWAGQFCTLLTISFLLVEWFPAWIGSNNYINKVTV